MVAVVGRAKVDAYQAFSGVRVAVPGVPVAVARYTLAQERVTRYVHAMVTARTPL